MPFMKPHLICLVILSTSASLVSAAEPWSALVSPSNSLDFKFLKADTPVAHASVIGWGPNWQWVGVGANEKAKGDKLDVTTQFAVNKGRGDVIDIRFQAHKSGPQQVVFQYDLSAEKDVPVTMV